MRQGHQIRISRGGTGGGGTCYPMCNSINPVGHSANGMNSPRELPALILQSGGFQAGACCLRRRALVAVLSSPGILRPPREKAGAGSSHCLRGSQFRATTLSEFASQSLGSNDENSGSGDLLPSCPWPRSSRSQFLRQPVLLLAISV